VDSDFLFETGQYDYNALEFALINTYETDKTVMWAPLIEKAFAKIKGNYEIANGGFIATGIKSLTGAPVYGYSISSIGETEDSSMSLS